MRQLSNKEDLRNDFAKFTSWVISCLCAGLSIVLIMLSIVTGHYALLPLATWNLLLVAPLSEVSTLRRSQNINTANDSEVAISAKVIDSAVVLWLLGTSSLAFCLKAPEVPSSASTVIAISAIASCVVIYGGIARYMKRSRDLGLPVIEALSWWIRATIWLSVAILALITLISLALVKTPVSIIQSLMVLSVLPALEWLLRTLANEGSRISVTRGTRLLQVFFAEANPLSSATNYIQRYLDIDLGSTWAFAVTRRFVWPMALCLLLLAWSTSGLITIPSESMGVHERFGRLTDRSPLPPGFHIVAPWPIDKVHRIATSHVRTIPLGYANPTPGASLLWTEQHAAVEYALLLGDGRDLLTINAELHYTVEDPLAWRYSLQNPDIALRALAEQALVIQTVGKTLNGVLSDNLAAFTDDITTEIETLIETRGLGVEVVSLTIQGLHPPVSVAEDYQAVVSAQHQSEIAILSSREYQIRTLSHAESSAMSRVNNAQAEGAKKIYIARGQSRAFDALRTQHDLYPASVEFMLRSHALEQALKNRGILVIDDRIEEDGGTLWFEQ